VKTEVELTNELELRTLAAELRIVLGRLIRRLRAEYRFGLTQASVLGRLDREGPQFIGELAAAERVRPQSMSQALDELEAEQLVERCPDATDGRRTRIALTAEGRAALEADRAARDGWLGKEITKFTPQEQEILQEAMLLIDRLANSD
jgi:DNA-binding MarR family transcriptional regulator